MKSALEVGKVPPDGGWGWMIVVATAISNIVIVPSITNFGLIFKDKFAEMKMPAADISLIMNINSAFGMSMGLINGPLLRNFGYRKVSIVAGILFSTGMTLMSFANSFAAFILTYGIVAAAGFGMAVSSFSLAQNSYFKVKRNKATGISMTLTGLGPIAYPQMISILLHYYGVQGCVLILGAICTHIIMAALLLQPLKWHMKDAPAVQDMEASSLDGRSSGTSKNYARSYQSNDTEEIYRGRHRTIIEADHEIDTQSIYGCEQMPIIRRPTHVPISKNDSDDDELNQSTTPNTSDNVFARSISHVLSTPNEMVPGDVTDVKVPAQSMRRWFEAGSDESVHLGSSDNIFSEKTKEPPVLHGIVEADSDKEEITLTTRDVALQNGEVKDQEATAILTGGKTKKRTIGKKVVRFFDLDLLRDKTYVNIMIGMSLAVFAELNFSVLTPFIFSDMNYTTIEIASLMSTLAVADLLSRFLAPFIGDHFDQPPRIMYMISLVLLIVVRTSVFAVSTYHGMLWVCVALGIAKGVRTVYMSLVIPTHVPIERLASAAGLQMVTNGVILMILGPLVGVIRDLSGSYFRCIVFINIITFTTLLMWIAELTYLRCTNRKK